MGAADVLAAVRAGGLLRAGAPVLVLLSGGRDSVCLLDVTVRTVGAAAVRALHVNYGLRDAAAADERLCRGLCDRMGIPLTVEAARPADRRAGNLQAWARDVRYAAAARCSEREGDAAVAVGHTASDQAETVLYRLAAAPGRRALVGMPARDGRLVRPLLGLTREDTAAYCRERALEWCEDASNVSPGFARTRVRHGLLEALRAVHPGAEANVVATATLLREEGEALDAAVDDMLGGRDALDLDALAALPAALGRLVLQRLADAAVPPRRDGRAALRTAGDRGGSAAVGASGLHGRPRTPTSDGRDAGPALLGRLPGAGRRLEEVLALRGGGGTRSLDLGRGVRAVVEYDVLRVTAESPPGAPAPVALTLGGRVDFGEWEVALRPAGEHRACEGSAVLDAISLRAPLVVRAWRAGDRMRPAGMGGTHSLQDLFTDGRVPRERRSTLPVIESAGEIVWVPGVAVGERFVPSEATRRTARLHARRRRG